MTRKFNWSLKRDKYELSNIKTAVLLQLFAVLIMTSPCCSSYLKFQKLIRIRKDYYLNRNLPLWNQICKTSLSPALKLLTFILDTFTEEIKGVLYWPIRMDELWTANQRLGGQRSYSIYVCACIDNQGFMFHLWLQRVHKRKVAVGWSCFIKKKTNK